MNKKLYPVIERDWVIRGTDYFDKTINFIKYLNERKKSESANYKIMVNSLLDKKMYIF